MKEQNSAIEEDNKNQIPCLMMKPHFVLERIWISDWLFLKNRKQYSSRDSLPVFVVYSRFRYWRRELRSE